MSKRQRYCFLWVFRNYTDWKFKDFYCVCYNFGTIHSRFFLTTKREVDNFILDLLKRSDT